MLIPLGDYIILEMEEKKDSKIIIPEGMDDRVNDESTIFNVLAVGPGFYQDGKLIPTNVDVGDKVFIISYGATKLEHKGKKVVLGRARDVVMKVIDDQPTSEDVIKIHE